MADFLKKRFFNTKKPQITVQSGLPAGEHRFQVTAVHEDGSRSEPVEVIVKIVETDTRGPIRRVTAEEAVPVTSSSAKAAALPTKRRPATKTKKTKRIRRKKKP